MTADTLRNALVNIARADANKLEVSRNRAPWIAKYWPATSYPEGHTNREPYCAAAVTYWVAEWLKNPAVLAHLKLTPARAEAWRCKSARAFDWQPWAVRRGLQVIGDGPGRIEAGDIMVFDMSHIGIVTKRTTMATVETIEANTGATGSRDGDGCFEKLRHRSLARCFIRIIA